MKCVSYRTCDKLGCHAAKVVSRTFLKAEGVTSTIMSCMRFWNSAEEKDGTEMDRTVVCLFSQGITTDEQMCYRRVWGGQRQCLILNFAGGRHVRKQAGARIGAPRETEMFEQIFGNPNFDLELLRERSINSS